MRKRKSIKETLIYRDSLTSKEAETEIDMIRDNIMDAIAEGDFDRAFYTCEYVGLEPDYLEDLI